ncbi:MAG: phosphatidylserine decarboxylase, partial [Myxococcales bacterium]|nr:phosphatidylserine decarboxylase [Myxococcales bacterium]
MKNNHEKTVSTKIKNSIFYFLLFILPKNFISLLVGKILSVAWPKSINLFLLRNFIKIFSINSNEAEKNIEDYESIQEFFCRRLGEGTRKISQKSNVVISPCDGVVSEFGLIENGRLLQVKGKYYQLSELLGCPKRAAHFEGGHFCTIYLSPRDYHRFH